MNKILLVPMLIAGFAEADEKKYYEAFGDDLKFYAEQAQCTERKGLELEMCIDAYRALVAEECIMRGRKDFCVYFKEMTKSKGLENLKMAVILTDGEDLPVSAKSKESENSDNER